MGLSHPSQQRPAPASRLTGSPGWAPPDARRPGHLCVQPQCYWLTSSRRVCGGRERGPSSTQPCLRRDSAMGPVSIPGLGPLPGAAPGPGKASGLSPAPATPGSLLQRALTWGWKGSPCQVRASEGPGSETVPGTSLHTEPSPGHREPLLEGGPPVCTAGSGACPPPWLRQSCLSHWAHPNIHFLSWVKAAARSCPRALRQTFPVRQPLGKASNFCKWGILGPGWPGGWWKTCCP